MEIQASRSGYPTHPCAHAAAAVRSGYVGKTRLVIEALKPCGASVLWSSRAEGLLVDHFRDLDTDEKETILVVDRCERSSTQQILEEAAARRRLKTILIREGSLSETGAAKLLVTPFEHDDTGKLVAELGRSWCEPSSWSSTRDPKTGKKSRAKTAKLVLGAMLEDMVLA